MMDKASVVRSAEAQIPAEGWFCPPALVADLPADAPVLPGAG